MTTPTQTQITAHGERWLINGHATYYGWQYRGWDVEGLLMNSRMTNAVFDDANPCDADHFGRIQTRENGTLSATQMSLSRSYQPIGHTGCWR